MHTSNGTTILCAYWDIFGRGDVTDRDMSFHITFSAAKLGYPIRNIPLDRIDTHLNRAGGACEMKLSGFDDESIIKMGRWLTMSNASWNKFNSSYRVYLKSGLQDLKNGRVSKSYKVIVSYIVWGEALSQYLPPSRW